MIRERIASWLDGAREEPPPKRHPRLSVHNADDARAASEGHASGPMTQGEMARLMAELAQYGRLSDAHTRRLVDAYTPNMRLDPHDGERPLQAATVKEMRSRQPGYVAPYLFNPRQSLDYYLIDTIATMTVMQSLISTKMRLIMGTGWKPKLYLKKPTAQGKTGEEEERAKEADDKRLSELEWITDVMEAVDRRVGTSTKGVKRVPLFSHFASLIRNTITYNRAVLIKQPGEPLEVDGKTYEGLPGGLIFVHPKDLGMVKVDEGENLTSVLSQWHGELAADEIIYLWNSYHGQERPRSNWYGLSFLDGCMATGRQMFRYQTETVPVMIKSSYTGAALVLYRAPGVDDDIRDAECERLASMIRPGTLSVVSADPAEVEVHPIDIKPQLGDVVAHNTEQIKEMCMHAEIPYSVVFDESASNRATLTGKLKFTVEGVIEPFRNWLNLELTPQWYGEMLQIICADKPEILEEVGVEMEWDETHLDADEDAVATLLQLHQAAPFELPALVRKAGYPDMVRHLDMEEVERRKEMGEDMGEGDGAPGAGGPVKVRNRDTGESFRVG